jgi:hypothetical protein
MVRLKCDRDTWGSNLSPIDPLTWGSSMRFATLSLSVCLTLLCSTAWGRDPDPYRPRGEPALEELEMRLYAILPVYAYGIPWSEQRMATEDLVERVPAQHIATLNGWLEQVLRPELLPERLGDVVWRGIRRHRGFDDFIVGSWQLAGGEIVNVLATAQYLHLTVSSSRNPRDMLRAESERLARSVLRLPAASDRRFEVREKQRQVIDRHLRTGTISGLPQSKEGQPADSPPDWTRTIHFWATAEMASFTLKMDFTERAVPEADPQWNF